MSPLAWNIIFWVIRYLLVALLLAYLTNVYVKKKNIHTDIKGRVLEWRVDTYKSIHKWVMKFQCVIAAPSQDEVHYRNILAPTKFKIGYQGMEYASFFHTPERLLQFGIEFKRMLNKEENFIDYPLKQKLESFQFWLDDVIMCFKAFVETEYDKKWKYDEKTKEKHCQLACRMLGIALQMDVNKFYGQIDDMLRDRLCNTKISGVYSESWWSKIKRKAITRCERIIDREEENKRKNRLIEWFYYDVLYRSYGCSQLLRNNFGLMTIFILVHFEDKFSKNTAILKDGTEFMKLTAEYCNCYSQYFEK